MNQAHVHLLITHLPIFGSFLGGIVLALGIWSKSNQTKLAAYYLFLISALGAGIAYTTGEAAEELVENIQGIAESTIEQHEDFALFALVSVIVLGFCSLLGIYLTILKSSLSNSAASIILVLTLISFVLFARTGYLGGKIRHTEIYNSTPTDKGSEDDD